MFCNVSNILSSVLCNISSHSLHPVVFSFLDQKFVGLGALLFVVPWSVHEVMKSHRNLCGFYNYFYYDHVGQLVVIK